MSHFYGKLQGNRGEATRCGSAESGMETYCASWNGAIRCKGYVDENNVDCVLVQMAPWQGCGEYFVFYDGPIGKFNPDNLGPVIKGLMK